MAEWQPIETASKDGTDILVYSNWGGEQFVAFWKDDDWVVVIQSNGRPYRLTGRIHYWMPLPEPPNG